MSVNNIIDYIRVCISISLFTCHHTLSTNTHAHARTHTHVGFHGKRGLFIGIMVFILYKPYMYHSLQETVHFYFIKKTNAV